MKGFLGRTAAAGIVISLLFAGCSNSPAPSAPPTGGDPAAISGELEIQYFIGGYGEEWWNLVFADFEKKYPDVTIIRQGGSTIHEEMKSRWIANDPPDIVEIEGAGISESQMVTDGQLMDLTEWIPTIQLAGGDKLIDRFIAPPNDYDGVLYSVPLIYDNRGTWFDDAWFTQKGWEIPMDVEAWQASMAQIKAEEGIPPIATTGVYPTVFMTGVLYPAWAGVGGSELLNAMVDGEEGAWSRPEVLEVMKRVESWVSAGYVDPGFAGLTHTQAQMNFLLHKNAYVPTGFWLPNEMRGDVPEDFEFGVIPTPFNKPGEKMTVVPEVKTIAVAQNAKNPVAAKAFIEFIMTEEYAHAFAKLAGAMLNITNVDLASDPDVPSYLKRANDLINNEEVVQLRYLAHPMHSDLSAPIGNALVSLLLGDSTAEEFVAAAEAAAADYRS
ncbi:MAG: ABC transporter substrate-binding protein [Propionicimonas sp.]